MRFAPLPFLSKRNGSLPSLRTTERDNVCSPHQKGEPQ